MVDSFSYIKYASLPWAYSPILPFMQNKPGIQQGSFPAKTVIITMQPGDIYEFIMATPGYITPVNSITTGIFTVMGALNPTATNTYANRYGLPHLLLTSLQAPTLSGFPTAMSIEFTTELDITYDVCRYSKLDTSVPDDVDILFATLPTRSGVIIPTKKLYMHSHSHVVQFGPPMTFAAKNKLDPPVFYCGKLRNDNLVSVNVTVKMTGSYARTSISVPPSINDNKMPISFVVYILEHLRNTGSDVHLVGTDEVELLKNTMIVKINDIIQHMAQNWYNFTKNVNINPAMLTNFIIYNLYYNGRSIQIS